MKIDWTMVLLGVVVAVIVNIAVCFLISPTAALIEAGPGGLLIGVLSQYRVFLNARRGAN